MAAACFVVCSLLESAYKRYWWQHALLFSILLLDLPEEEVCYSVLCAEHLAAGLCM